MRQTDGDAYPEASQYPVVPTISRFLGIEIAMFYNDHSPPHFHAAYGEFEITVTIQGGVVTGRFPRRALSHVLEWLMLRRVELGDNWERARRGETLAPVPPLE